jgi:hypothetical protein
MTLALLLTAVTGAWAEEKSETIPTTTSQKEYTGEHFKITTSNKQDGGLLVADFRYYAGGQVFFFIETLDGQNISKLDLQIDNIDDTSIDNLSLSSGTKSYDSNTKVLTITNVNDNFVQITLTEGDEYGVVTISSVTYYYEDSPAEAPVTVEWNASTKTGTFAMPGSDVVLTPIYAKAATFATTGTGSEVKTLLPAAAEGVIAGTDASLIAEGTGIVAFAGTSAEVKQGTLMYAIGTSATEAPDAFSATVPTAKDVADDGADVYVWYYIKGADTPQDQDPTAENTFNDTEPACLTVTVLTNKFDIQFNAANANTIEAGKATVTVDGTAQTVTEGKLEGVKMGREVKMTAKEGYKFRKVEVKKKAAEADLSETITFSGGKNANYTYTGTHFSATGDADPTDGTFELNKWSSVTINATDGKTITKVVFSYRENGNNDLDQLSFSSGTFDGIDTVNDVNATMLSVTSTTVGATKLNGVTIYYK